MKNSIFYRNGKYLGFLPFKWKIGLLFALFERFLVKIWAISKVKRSEWKSNLAYARAMNPEVLNIQRFWSDHFAIWSLSITNVFFLNFNPVFQVPGFVAFQSTTPTFLIKIKFVCHFLFLKFFRVNFGRPRNLKA